MTTAIVLINYNEQQAVHLKLNTLEECTPYLATQSVSWIDVQGLGNEDILQRIGQVFKLHPLILEDVVKVPQRPKCEDYDNQQLTICHMVLADDAGMAVTESRWALILGVNYVLTIQEESKHDCF